MTFEAWSMAYLTNRGLWPQEAEAVIAAAKADKANEAISDRWNDSTDDYHSLFTDLLNLALDSSALEWIDANKPKHFARPIFAGEAPAVL